MCDVALDPYTSHGHDELFLMRKLTMIKQLKFWLNNLYFKRKWDVMLSHHLI